MATTDLRADSAFAQLPPHFAPMPAVMRTLAQFDRARLEGFITVAISLLDVIDGDPDAELSGDEGEPNGDELDGTNAEDEIGDATMDGLRHGPGCLISDPDYCPTEFAELDEGEYDYPHAYGVDQTREAGADNPAVH